MRRQVRAALDAGAEAVEDMLAEEQQQQHLARVTDIRGAHCEVEIGRTGERLLAQIPAKFKAVVWVRRGNVVVVRVGDVPPDSRFKLRGTLVHVLTPTQIAQLRRRGPPLWPAAFDDAAAAAPAPKGAADQDEGDDDDDDDDDPFAGGNPNRRRVVVESDSSSEDEESD